MELSRLWVLEGEMLRNIFEQNLGGRKGGCNRLREESA
jgi:hypothetical protein